MMQNLENNLRKYKASWIALFCIIFLFILTIQLNNIANAARYAGTDTSNLENVLDNINTNLDEIRKKYTDSFI